MTKKISKGDIQLLLWIAEYKFLTAKQLGSLSKRSRQVIRRKQRDLESGNYVTIQEQRFGLGPGRSENIVLLTANVIYSFQGEFSFDRTGFAAETAISVIPVLIVFFIFQNYFVSGLSGAVKG